MADPTARLGASAAPSTCTGPHCCAPHSKSAPSEHGGPTILAQSPLRQEMQRQATSPVPSTGLQNDHIQTRGPQRCPICTSEHPMPWTAILCHDTEWPTEPAACCFPSTTPHAAWNTTCQTNGKTHGWQPRIGPTARSTKPALTVCRTQMAARVFLRTKGQTPCLHAKRRSPRSCPSPTPRCTSSPFAKLSQRYAANCLRPPRAAPTGHRRVSSPNPRSNMGAERAPAHETAHVQNAMPGV